MLKNCYNSLIFVCEEDVFQFQISMYEFSLMAVSYGLSYLDKEDSSLVFWEISTLF